MTETVFPSTVMVSANSVDGSGLAPMALPDCGAGRAAAAEARASVRSLNIMEVVKLLLVVGCWSLIAVKDLDALQTGEGLANIYVMAWPVL